VDLNKKINTAVVSISFSFFIILNIFIDMIGSTKNFYLDLLLMLVLKAITFSLLNFIVGKVYKFYWSNKNKSLDVSGEWYHVHLIADKNDYLRVGTVRISQNYFYLSLTGQNNCIKYENETNTYETLDATTTTWFEKGIVKEDTKTFEGVYSATRNFANISTRNGIHTFTFYYDNKGKTPSKIYGGFYDASPFNRSGSITMFKNKEDCDRYIVELCKKNPNNFEEKSFVSSVSENDC